MYLQRSRLDSIPIVNGIGVGNLNESENDLEIVVQIHQTEARKRDRPSSDKIETKSIGDINSPEAKKVKNDSQKVMETMDVIDKDLAVVYSTRVISKLEIDTNDRKVIELINCYNPVLYGDFDMMKKHMFDVSEGWNDKEKIYKTAIMYVLNDGKECLENDIDQLAETLLATIENRMPNFCKDCNIWYIVSRENDPTVFCTWCQVGKHDCKQFKDTNLTQGMKWFCGKCDDLFTNQIQPKMRKFKNIHFEGFEESGEIVNLQTKTKEKDDTVEIKNGEEIIEIKDDDNKKDENKTPENAEQEVESSGSIPGENVTPDTNTKKICWFWTNRKCKFGNRCKDEHPEQCKAMMETGKCADNRCKLIHPKICRGIYFENYCSRRNCRYVHPTKLINRYVFNDNHNRYNNNNNSSNTRNLFPGQTSNMTNNQTTSSQGNQNVPWNPHMNNQRFQSDRNGPTFLEHWPTPWETSRSAKMLVNRILEEVTSKIMNL